MLTIYCWWREPLKKLKGSFQIISNLPLVIFCFLLVLDRELWPFKKTFFFIFLYVLKSFNPYNCGYVPTLAGITSTLCYQWLQRQRTHWILLWIIHANCKVLTERRQCVLSYSIENTFIKYGTSTNIIW